MECCNSSSFFWCHKQQYIHNKLPFYICIPGPSHCPSISFCVLDGWLVTVVYSYLLLFVCCDTDLLLLPYAMDNIVFRECPTVYSYPLAQMPFSNLWNLYLFNLEVKFPLFIYELLKYCYGVATDTSVSKTVLLLRVCYMSKSIIHNSSTLYTTRLTNLFYDSQSPL